MINFLWLEEIVDDAPPAASHLHPGRLTVRALARFVLLGVALLVTIFVARFNAVSVLLGFSMVVVGIMGEAVYSMYRSFRGRSELNGTRKLDPLRAVQPCGTGVTRSAWDVPDHVIMAVLVLVICLIVFPLATRRISRDNPGHFQQILELLVGGLGTCCTTSSATAASDSSTSSAASRRSSSSRISSASSSSCSRRPAIRTRPSLSPSARSSTTTIRASRRRASCTTSSTSPGRCRCWLR